MRTVRDTINLICAGVHFETTDNQLTKSISTALKVFFNGVVGFHRECIDSAHAAPRFPVKTRHPRHLVGLKASSSTSFKLLFHPFPCRRCRFFAISTKFISDIYTRV